jgi:ribonuclease HI
MKYKIFTDGSSRGNPGPGGWGAVIVCGEEKIIELGGGEKNTTNNRMELTAALESFKKLNQLMHKDSADAALEVFTDSSYLINGITKWVPGWIRNGWKTKTKDDVLNKDIWSELYSISKSFNIKWNHIGGHVGIVGNERCDEIATQYADGEKVELYHGSFAKYKIQNILDLKHDSEKAMQKKGSSERSRAKAYSYISAVGGVVMTHKTWGECEKRVRGVKGAKYKKALDRGEEAEIMRDFQG